MSQTRTSECRFRGSKSGLAVYFSESNMAPITRRDFVKQTAFTAATLCGCPIDSLAETRRRFRTRELNAAMVVSAAIGKVDSQITGHVNPTDGSNNQQAR